MKKQPTKIQKHIKELELRIIELENKRKVELTHNMQLLPVQQLQPRCSMCGRTFEQHHGVFNQQNYGL